MTKGRWLISGLVAAGITPVNALQAQDATDGASRTPMPEPDYAGLVRKFAQDHYFHLAQHRSHSSHASHASHRSGSSGIPRAPVYTPPAPRLPRATPIPSPTPSSTRNERSTPPSSILPSSPQTAPRSLYSPPVPSSTVPSRSQIETVVCKVQTGLMAYGYYDGQIDCVVGPMTRAALRRFQEDYSLKVTGTITPEVLDAFRITAE